MRLFKVVMASVGMLALATPALAAPTSPARADASTVRASDALTDVSRLQDGDGEKKKYCKYKDEEGKTRRVLCAAVPVGAVVIGAGVAGGIGAGGAILAALAAGGVGLGVATLADSNNSNASSP